MSTPGPEEIIARATCRARGINPDECVMGSGWAGTSGGGSECHVYAWQQELGVAQAAIKALEDAGALVLSPDETRTLVEALDDAVDAYRTGNVMGVEEARHKLRMGFPALFNAVAQPAAPSTPRDPVGW